jgi:hypothetical protein
MKALMNFTFQMDEVWKEQLRKRILFVIFSVILFTNRYKSARKKVLNGFTTSGFENLEPNTYLFISIIGIFFDTTLLNTNICFEHWS